MTDKDIFAQLRKAADEAAARANVTDSATPADAPAAPASGGGSIADLLDAAKRARDAQAQADENAARSENKARPGS